jgi:hypothetical protein
MLIKSNQSLSCESHGIYCLADICYQNMTDGHTGCRVARQVHSLSLEFSHPSSTLEASYLSDFMEYQILIQSRLIDPDEARIMASSPPFPSAYTSDMTSPTRLLAESSVIGVTMSAMEKKALTSFSHLGNLNAFAYTEALPERLGVLSYLLDLGLIHDGMCFPHAMVFQD